MTDNEPPRQVPAHPADSDALTETQRQRRDDAYAATAYAAELANPCPHCHAEPGQPCRNPITGRPFKFTGTVHPQRIRR